MTVFNPTKGMKDFSSTIANKRHVVMEKIKSAYKKNGFSYIETPAVESFRY